METDKRGSSRNAFSLKKKEPGGSSERRRTAATKNKQKEREKKKSFTLLSSCPGSGGGVGYLCPLTKNPQKAKLLTAPQHFATEEPSSLLSVLSTVEKYS